jgi:O-antigen ligase
MTSISQPTASLAGTRTPSLAPVAARLRMELDGYRLFMFVLTIITISRIHQHFHAVAMLRPALLMVAMAGLYAFLNPKKLAAESMLRTWPARAVVAFGVLACISVPFGISLGGSGLFILEEYSKTLLFAVLVILAIRSARDLYAFTWAYVVSTGILVWMSLFVFGLEKATSGATRLNKLYTYDANDVGLVVLVGLGLTLLTLQTSGKLGRVVSAVVLVGIGATIARTGSRGAFVGLLAVGLALLFLLKSVSVVKRVVFIVVTALGLTLWAPQGYWEQMETIKSPTQDYNWSATNGRKQVAKRGIGYMMNHPLFGLGINNFWRAECFDSEKARTHIAGTGIKCSASHNSYVEAGAELGIPGLVLWIVLIFGGIRGMLKLRRRLPPAWARGSPEDRFLYLAPLYIAVAMVGFAVSSFFVSFAWMDPVYYLAALMAGVYSVTGRRLGTATVAGPVAVPVRGRTVGGTRVRQVPPHRSR